MDPKRKVVMPPITHVGVLAKKAPICKPNSLLSPEALLNGFTSACMRAVQASWLTCKWLGKCQASLNASKRIEIVTAKQMTKHKHRDKSRFTSLLKTLNNSGDKSQQHQDLQHSTCTFVQCRAGEGVRG